MNHITITRLCIDLNMAKDPKTGLPQNIKCIHRCSATAMMCDCIYDGQNFHMSAETRCLNNRGFIHFNTIPMRWQKNRLLRAYKNQYVYNDYALNTWEIGSFSVAGGFGAIYDALPCMSNDICGIIATYAARKQEKQCSIS